MPKKMLFDLQPKIVLLLLLIDRLCQIFQGAYDFKYHSNTGFRSFLLVCFLLLMVITLCWFYCIASDDSFCPDKRRMSYREFFLAYRNSWTLDARVGRWTLDAGFWTLGPGRWTLDTGRWTLDVGCYTLDAGFWARNTIADCFKPVSDSA